MSQQLRTMMSGLAVLEYIRGTDILTINDIRGLLECSRPTAYRMVATLVESGYLVRASDRQGHVAGPALLRTFDASVLDSPHRPLIRSFLYRIRDLTEASVHSSSLIGTSAFAVDGYRSRIDMHLGGRVGMSAPAHVMAAGKLLLSQLDSGQVDALFPDDQLPPWRSARITTKAALVAELAGIRAAGYAVADEESESSVVSVAIPFVGSHWRSRSALVLSRSSLEVQAADLIELLPIIAPHLETFQNEYSAAIDRVLIDEQ